MKRSVIILAAVSVLIAACAAQEPADQNQGQSVVAAAKASRAQVKSAESKEADVRQLLELTHAGAVATQTMDAMEGNMRTLMTNAFPPGEYREKLIDLFFAKFHEKRDTQQLVEMAVPVYSKYYSDDEIKQLIQLYQTPVGQKLLGVTTKIIAELQGAGQKWGEELGRQSMMEVLAEHPEMEKALEQAQRAAKSGGN